MITLLWMKVGSVSLIFIPKTELEGETPSISFPMVWPKTAFTGFKGWSDTKQV